MTGRPKNTVLPQRRPKELCRTRLMLAAAGVPVGPPPSKHLTAPPDAVTDAAAGPAVFEIREEDEDANDNIDANYHNDDSELPPPPPPAAPLVSAGVPPPTDATPTVPPAPPVSAGVPPPADAAPPIPPAPFSHAARAQLTKALAAAGGIDKSLDASLPLDQSDMSSASGLSSPNGRTSTPRLSDQDTSESDDAI